MKKISIGSVLMTGLALATPATVMAHAGAHHQLTFTEGLLHPLSGWDHLALLIASGAIMAYSTHRGWRPHAWELTGMAGMFASGIAVMLGNWPLCVLALLVAGFGLARGSNSFAKHGNLDARGGIVAAVGLQTASHYLASNDAIGNVEFAAGFTATSLAVFFASDRICSLLPSYRRISRMQS